MFRVVLAEQTISFVYSSNYGAYISNSNPSLFLPIAGETYSIGWDGTDYTCVAFTLESAANQVMLGNTFALGGEDTGVPFFMSSIEDGSGMTMFALDTNESHSIHVHHKVTVDSNDSTTIVPEQAIPGFVEDGAFYMTMLEMYMDIIKPGSTYSVSWDGIIYVCTATIFDGITVVGNQAFDGGVDTGEPFMVVLAPPEKAGNSTGITIIATSDAGESHDLAVYKSGSGCLLDKQTLINGQNITTPAGQKAYIYYIMKHLFVLEANKTYRVIIDDTEYLSIAKEITADGVTAAILGNATLGDPSLEDTGEPFYTFSFEPGDIGGETGLTTVLISDTVEPHTIAIYAYEESVNGASITLFDNDGVSQTYEGVDKISLLTPEGDRQVYTCGQLHPVTPELEVDFTKGNQKISAGDGFLVREAILKKPTNLLPENILKGINIAGIIGKFEVVDNVEVPLSMADGNQEAVSCGALQAVKRVVVLKPETLIPENIAKGIDIGGVIGSFAGGKGEHKDIVPDFADGDYTVVPEEDGVMFDSVTVKKPASLLPSNIVSGVDIAGVIGAYEAPKLYKPTNVTGPTLDATKNLYYYTVTNPTASNGAFADTVLVVNASENVMASVPCAGATTKIYADAFTGITSWIVSNFYAKLAGAGFSPSDMWDTNANIYGVVLIEYSLSNVALDKQPTSAYQKDTLTLKATATDGYYLPKTATFIGKADTFIYDPDNGTITLSNFTLDFDNHVYSLNISAVDTPWLRDPKVISFEDNILKVWYDANTEYLVLTVNGEIISQVTPIPYASIPEISITTKPSGASYGFILGSDGYYISENKAVNNSYAICRIDVVTSEATILTLDCINYAESGYDYGLISKVDTSFAFSNTSDSTYFKSFKGASSTSVVQLSYEVPAGEHFFYIKYRKDSSGNTGNDAFKFKISNATEVIATEHCFDMSNLLTNYINLDTSIKSIATGYTESEEETILIEYMPTTSLRGKTLTIGNLLETVTSVQVYFDDVLIDTIDRTDASIEYDLSAYYTDYATVHTVYVVALGDDVAENSSSVLEIKPYIYGVSQLNKYSATELVRTDDAITMSYTINSDGTVDSDFDYAFPWCAIEIVEDSFGNKFVQLPRMFFRVTHSSYTLSSIAVSAAPKEGEDNWFEVEPFCVGCYLARTSNSKLQSVSGVTPSSGTMKNFDTYGKAVGDGYIAYDLYHETILKFLWWIEYANKNSQSIMTGAENGKGANPTSGTRPTGDTDTIVTPSGYEPDNHRMRYRYIEDFIGNNLIWLNGCWITSSKVAYGTTDPSGFSTNTYANMRKLSYSTPSAGCITGYGWDPANPFLCLPIGTTSDSTYLTHFCCNYNPSSYNIPSRGSYKGNSGAVFGLDFMTTHSGTTTGYSSYAGWNSTRLLYLGTLTES